MLVFLALILLGFDLDEFSMSSLGMLQIKKLIRTVSYEEAKKLAEEVLSLPTGAEVEEVSMARLKKLAPEII